MSKQNIVLVCTNFHAFKIFFVEQTKLLSRLGKVTVVCPAEESEFKEEFSEIENIDHVNLRIGREIYLFSDLISLIKLFKLLINLKPIMIHSLFPKAGFMGMTVGFLARIPIRLHIFTGQIWVTSRGIKRILLKGADKIISLCSTHIMADGHAQKSFLISENIVTEKKATVLGKGSISGIDLERFNNPKLHGILKKKTFVCIFLGRLTHEKGFNLILDAFEYFGDSHQKIELIVAGIDEDGFKGRMQQLSDQYSNVNYKGFTSKPEEELAKADLLLIPSRREGFCGVVIEAGAMGIPCIGTDIYGLYDTFIDGETGLRIPPDNLEELIKAIDRIMKDKELYNLLSSNARNYTITNFSHDYVLKNWKNFYIKLLKEIN